MKYILDTNIILHFARNSELWQNVKTKYQLQSDKNQIYIENN